MATFSEAYVWLLLSWFGQAEIGPLLNVGRWEMLRASHAVTPTISSPLAKESEF